MPRKPKGGYYRNGKYIAVDWGDKISLAQQSESYKAGRKREYICGGCGETKIGTIGQRYCNYNCRYASIGKDPVVKKAFTLSSPVTFGKGRKVFFEKLVGDSLGRPCRYCSTTLQLETISLDHIIPFSESKWRNNPAVKRKLDTADNLQIICKTCNSMKGNLPHDKFVKLLSFMDMDLEIGQYLRRKLAQSNIVWSYKRNAKKSVAHY